MSGAEATPRRLPSKYHIIVVFQRMTGVYRSTIPSRVEIELFVGDLRFLDDTGLLAGFLSLASSS